MSARDIIRQIQALPLEERQEVIAFFQAEQAEVKAEAVGKRMSFREAKEHVFTEYRDVLEELAK